MVEKRNINIPEMLARLDAMYERENQIVIQMNILKKEYEQLQEDKELLQNMIMYQSNKNKRMMK